MAVYNSGERQGQRILGGWVTRRLGFNPSQLWRVWGLVPLSQMRKFLGQSLLCVSADTSPTPTSQCGYWGKGKKCLSSFLAEKNSLFYENSSCYHFTIIMCSEVVSLFIKKERQISRGYIVWRQCMKGRQEQFGAALENGDEVSKLVGRRVREWVSKRSSLLVSFVLTMILIHPKLTFTILLFPTRHSTTIANSTLHRYLILPARDIS